MKPFYIFILIVLFSLHVFSQKNEMAVVAYYSGHADGLDQFDAKKLTHIIFSFCHLNGNKLAVDNDQGKATINKLVSLKEKNPQLKVLLSLGGWGGCKTCSEVFSTSAGRKEFAGSVKDLCEEYKVDGLDLDWEYPAIQGYPEHPFDKSDKENFTMLVKELRKKLGKKRVITFAAGGFTSYVLESINWKKVMRKVDYVNLMSYDLTSGFSKVTGHHTPLYSNTKQLESADHAIHLMDSLRVPLKKIIIGAAFYARTWENVAPVDNGIYQSGNFKSFISFSRFDSVLNNANGYVMYYDSIAKAPFAYSDSLKTFATFDNIESIQAKTEYVGRKGLGGIMFWELSLDKPVGGLLDAIYEKKLFLGK